MLQLTVEAIKWETVDTATFFLKEVTGRPIVYQAGQFLTLVFTHHEEEIRRSYSLSSSPDEPLPAITIKRIENGEISRFMLTKIKPGELLNAVEPAGRFVVNDFESGRDIFFFGAGSGITPIFSQLKFILNRPGTSKLVLIYSSQDAASVLFQQKLNELQVKHQQRLKIIYLLSSEAKRLNNIVAEQLVRQNLSFTAASASFYICGPFTYMRMVRLTLLYMGFEPVQIRKENFVLETVPVRVNTLNYPPRSIKIFFNNELYDLMVGENQSILQAALQNNIHIPYSCRNGVCSTCTAKCINGKIEMVKNDVLTDADQVEGLVLTCTGHPLTDDVVIEL